MASSRARRRALVLVPAVALVGVWAHTAVSSTPVPQSAPLSAPRIEPVAPPTEPASISVPESAAPTSALVRDVAVAHVGSPSDIPSLALAAYQRAASVLATADPACGLRWELVAAIGRVESDHGRHGGAVLNKNGVAKPAIFGPRLDGRGATARLRDSDAGALDDDRRFDRAVGPLQFIPSTWSVVGVDADGDGDRNPQDIDDAALAAAVYLCAGGEDLGTDDGRREAVHRYNHSDAYVDLVLRVMDSYMRSNSLTGTFATAAMSLPLPDLARTVPLDVTPDGRHTDTDPAPGPYPGPDPRSGARTQGPHAHARSCPGARSSSGTRSCSGTRLPRLLPHPARPRRPAPRPPRHPSPLPAPGPAPAPAPGNDAPGPDRPGRPRRPRRGLHGPGLRRRPRGRRRRVRPVRGVLPRRGGRPAPRRTWSTTPRAPTTSSTCACSRSCRRRPRRRSPDRAAP